MKSFALGVGVTLLIGLVVWVGYTTSREDGGVAVSDERTPVEATPTTVKQATSGQAERAVEQWWANMSTRVAQGIAACNAFAAAPYATAVDIVGEELADKALPFIEDRCRISPTVNTFPD